MAYYENIVLYIGCSSDKKEQIARINTLIKALEDTELLAAGNADIEEYRLDDGQTIVKAINRDISSIENTIAKLIKRRTKLQNECVGFRYGLQDGNVIY